MRYFVLSVWLLAGCATTCPKVKATRCNGQVVEVCGTNKKWQRVMDCTQATAIKPGAPTKWTCQQVDVGHKCLPGGAP